MFEGCIGPETQMTSPDRLAQALRDNLPAIGHSLNTSNCAACNAVANLRAALAEHDALASLATAAVDGDIRRVDIVSWEVGHAHGLKVMPCPSGRFVHYTDHAAQVAALTAQCDGLTKQITVTPKTLDALKALVKEINQDARAKRAQGMRDTPDLLENYAIRIDDVLKKYWAKSSPDRRTMVYALRPAVALIAAERERQIAREGWSPKHDRDEHGIGELAVAAACYASSDDARVAILAHWPWGLDWWKPTPNDRVRELVKAGALIVAEIERLSESVCKQCRGTGEVYDTQGAPWHCPSCMSDFDNGCVNWPRDPANGRLLCTPERPMPKDAEGQWAHSGSHCTHDGEYRDWYACRDCGTTWYEELPE